MCFLFMFFLGFASSSDVFNFADLMNLNIKEKKRLEGLLDESPVGVYSHKELK